MSTKYGRQSITLETKYRIIKLIEDNNTYEDIYRLFPNIKCHNISKILKNKVKYVSEYESSTSNGVKKLRKSKFPEIDKQLIEFISEANSSGVAINSSVILREKAQQIATDLQIIDLKVNDNFIARFKKRNSAIFQKIRTQSEGHSEVVTNKLIKNKLSKLLKDFKEEDVYSGQEFDLFWRLLPNKTYRIKGQTFETENQSKEKVSVFVCSNMTGSEKLKLIVVGRDEEPICFRGKNTVPVVYSQSRKFSIKSDIFVEFLEKLDLKMKNENRFIALLLHSCSPHQMEGLHNIKLIFLPPNTASGLQPMNLGVIHSIKTNYRLKISRKLWALLEVNPNPSSGDIDLYEALLMLKKSWDEVTPELINNCFIKSGFNCVSMTRDSEQALDFDWNHLTQRLSVNGLDFEEYVSVDDSIPTSEPNQQLIEIKAEISDFENSLSEEPVKLIDAMNAISTLRKYLYESNANIDSSLDLVDKIEANVFKCGSIGRQSKKTVFKTSPVVDTSVLNFLDLKMIS